MSSLPVSLFWFFLFAGGGVYLAYNRINLLAATVATGAALVVTGLAGRQADWIDPDEPA